MPLLPSLDRVHIQVSACYEPSISNAEKQEYFFFYEISIKNQHSFPIKLIYRHLNIFDVAIGKRQVEGPGVVGEKPIIHPSDSFTYGSFCFLKYPLGSMEGSYDFVDLYQGITYNVSIPKIALYAPYLLN